MPFNNEDYYIEDNNVWKKTNFAKRKSENYKNLKKINDDKVEDFRNKNLTKIKDVKDINIVKGFRTFANKDNLLVAKAIQESGPGTLSELRSITGIENTNNLNHRLCTLRDADIVIKVGTKYSLTTYGATLLYGYFAIIRNLEQNKRLSNKSLLEAFDGDLFIYAVPQERKKKNEMAYDIAKVIYDGAQP